MRDAALVAGKDLRIELRSKEIIYTMAFFGALLVVVYAFAFPRDERAVIGSLPGMLWVTIAFTGTIGLGRAFDRERENDTMRALLLAPVPRLAVFLGKAISIAVMIIGITLFVRLAQSLFRPHKVFFPCPQCGLQRHEPDAVHCKSCGHVLNIPDDNR